MKYIIKIILSISDFFTQQEIIKKIKNEFKNKKSIVMIDVGSHKGEYISSLKKHFNFEKVYGFEPNKDVFKILYKNFSSNNTQLYNVGISNKSGEIVFNKNIDSTSSSINNLNEKSKYYKKKFFFLNFLNSKKITSQVVIKVLRLDEFIISNNINKIDLLKIDTEGFEYNVIKSLGSKIYNVKLVHFEHHFDDMIIKNYKISDIHNYLIENGFIKIFKIKMKFRKSFEYIYCNKKNS